MNSIRSQRGAGHIVLVLVVVLLAALGAAGWYIWQKRSGNPAPLATVGLQTVKCEYDDKDLCKFLNNFRGLDAFSVASTSGSGAQATEYHMVINGDDSQTIMKTGGKETMNSITIKDTTYTKDYSDNKWWKETATKEDSKLKDDLVFDDSSNDQAGQPAEPVQKTQYKAMGKEACGKLNCFKYEVIEPGDDSGGKQYIWFDDKQYRMRKTQTVTSEGSYNSEYSYDKVKVSVPSPVKEGTPGSTGGAGGPSQAEIDKAIQDAQAAAESMQ